MDATHDLQKLLFKIVKMRDAQKRYFATRSHDALSDSKKYEKEVDAMVHELKKQGYKETPPAAQPAQGSLI